MRVLLALLAFLSMSYSLLGQEDSFKIFLFKQRYSARDIQFVEKYKTYGYYDLFSQGYLESRTKKGHIDLQKVRISLRRHYPSKDANGYLVLDFEGLVFHYLKDNNPRDGRFKEAELEFIRMLELVKSERPNLKVGIYGLPFKFYFNNQRRSNDGNKFDEILKKADFIAPSLYVLYSENENKYNENIRFLKENLTVSLQISRRINKPVIPFFWYMVNPVNKTYGHEVISSEYLNKYLDVIKNTSLQGTKARGVFWWDVSENYFDKYMKESVKGKRNKHAINSKMDLFRYYNLENLSNE